MEDILVVAATKKEIKASFYNISLPSLKMGEPAKITLWKRNITLLVCGIGPINAAIFTERVLVTKKIKGVINIGIAGSFDLKKIPVGSLTLVTKEIWPEYGLKTREGIDPKGLKYGLTKLKDGNIIFNEIHIPTKENFLKMGLSFKNNFYTTTSLTVAGVTGTLEEAEKLKKSYNANIENMEGFAIAYVCLIHKIPFIEIRSISNLVGSRDTEKWNIKRALTSLKDALKIFEV
jgi:futalosine hydrolase